MEALAASQGIQWVGGWVGGGTIKLEVLDVKCNVESFARFLPVKYKSSLEVRSDSSLFCLCHYSIIVCLSNCVKFSGFKEQA